MKNIFIRLLILALTLSSFVFGESFMKEGAKLGEWTQDLDAAQALAQEKNLPLFLNFTGSDWCGWCIHMDKEVFDKTAWKDYAAENFVLVAIDFPNERGLVPKKFKARNEELAKEFQVRGYPTYYIVSADLKKPLGQLGASREVNPGVFIEEIEKILQSAG